MTRRTENGQIDITPGKSPTSNRYFWWGITLSVTLATILMAFPIESRSFEIDEVYELKHLSLSILDVAKDPDGFPPLFRWLLSFFILGSGEDMSRIFCVLAGVATVVVCGLLGRTIGGELVGFNASLIFAVSASQVAFGQLLRAYSLYTLAIAFTMLSGLWLSQKASRLNWALFIVSSFLAMGVHYYSIYFLAVIWIFVLCNYAKDQYHVFFINAFLFALICIPWLLCLRIDLSEPLPPEWINGFDLNRLAYLYLSLIQGKFLGPSQTEILESSRRDMLITLAPWAIAGFFFAFVLFRKAILNFRFGALAWFWIMLLVLPAFAGGVAMFISSTFGARYLAPLSVPFAIIIACGMRWRGKSLPVFSTYGLIALNLLSVLNRSLDPRYDRENYRQLVAEMTLYDPFPAVIVLSHYVAPAIHRELNQHSPFCDLGLGGKEPDDWEQKTTQFIKMIGDRDKIFLVTTSRQGSEVTLRQYDRLISLLNAKSVSRISNSTDLFIVKVEDIVRSLRNRVIKRDP